MSVNKQIVSKTLWLWISMGIIVLLTTNGALLASQSLDSTGTMSKEHDESNDEEYWTPDRLRNAKPLELPHPADPENVVTEPPGTIPKSDTSPPSEEGSPGDPDIFPEN